MATTFRRLPNQLFSFDYIDEGDFFKLPHDDSIFVKLPGFLTSTDDYANAYNFTDNVITYFTDSKEVIPLDAVINLKERISEGR